jgi:serpin B
VETLRARYGAEAGEVDFAGSPGRAARTINAWASEATRGRVPRLLDEGEAVTLHNGVLASLVYFTGPWLEPLDEGSTWEGPFCGVSGRRDVPMMHGVGTHAYSRAGHVEALQLPYAVSRIRMIVLLPEHGHLEDAEEDLEQALLHELIESAEPRRSRLSMPRCRVEATTRLRAPLESLGIRQAFGPAADFSPASEKEGVFLDDVLHHSFVEIDECGTEAAASGGALSKARREPRSDGARDFRVDRPFLFLVCDVESETLFFIGRVLDPGG